MRLNELVLTVGYDAMYALLSCYYSKQSVMPYKHVSNKGISIFN